MNLKLNKLFFEWFYHASCEAEALPLKCMRQKWNVEVQNYSTVPKFGVIIFLWKFSQKYEAE